MESLSHLSFRRVTVRPMIILWSARTCRARSSVCSGWKMPDSRRIGPLDFSCVGMLADTKSGGSNDLRQCLRHSLSDRCRSRLAQRSLARWSLTLTPLMPPPFCGTSRQEASGDPLWETFLSSRWPGLSGNLLPARRQTTLLKAPGPLSSGGNLHSRWMSLQVYAVSL